MSKKRAGITYWLLNKNLLNAVSLMTSTAALLIMSVGVFMHSQEIRVVQQTALAELKIDYYKLLQEKNEIHQMLSPGYPWHGEIGAPSTNEEWSALFRYMGLLEQIESWRRNGIIDIDQIDANFSHRIAMVYLNKTVREEHLLKETDRWVLFNSLVASLQDKPVFSRLAASVKE